MTTFRPGDLAQVVPGGQLYGADLEPGDLIEVIDPLFTKRGDVLVTDALGEIDRACGNGWAIHPDALRLVPADEQAKPTPTPSPLDALIESALALIQDVRAGRVRIEATWHATNRTDYSVIVTPEEKS